VWNCRGKISRKIPELTVSSHARYDDFYQLDMGVEKQFKFGRTKWAAAFDLFNVMNSNVFRGRTAQQNSTRANFDTEVLVPRVARLGARLNF